MADNNQYTLPPDLSSILATLAQYAPQFTTPVNQDLHVPPGLPLSQQQYHQKYHQQLQQQPQSDEIAAILAAAAAQAQPQAQTPVQDLRLLHRSRVQTPETHSLSHPPPYVEQFNNEAYSLNLQRHPPHHQQHSQPPSQAQPRHSQYDQYQRSNDSSSTSLRGGSSQPQPRPTQASQIIDPATITVWSEGLRCVNKIAAQNQDFAGAIRRMISNQQKHEMQWYQGRQELKQTQARRATGASEIHNILGSIGGSTFNAPSTPTPQQTPEEKEAELRTYDVKVYKAQLVMHNSMEAELKALGVPFFGTHADRIIADDDDATKGGSGSVGKETDGQPKWSPRITKKELVELQKRIIAFLEDMYKE